MSAAQDRNGVSMLLAVETSGSEGSVALAEQGTLIADRVLQTHGRRHAQTLVAEVRDLIRDAGLSPADISEVAISLGPGSFTGLRVGLVFAKTFAWVNQARLIPVDTLQALAERLSAVPVQETAARLTNDPTVTVISDAQRDDVFCNEYRRSGSAVWQPVGEVRIEPLDEVIRRARFVTGPGLQKFAERFPDSVRLADSCYWQPRAAAVARVAASLSSAMPAVDMNSLEPVYLRRSYAEEKRDSG